MCIQLYTFANVIGATITTMTKHFGCKLQDIRSAIGLSIGPCYYEIGMDIENYSMIIRS